MAKPEVKAVKGPVAGDDGPFNTAYNTNITIDAATLLANDQGDTKKGPLAITSITADTGGTATLINGGKQVVFNPDDTFSGVATFTYVLADGTKSTDSGDVRINVAAAPPPPAQQTVTLNLSIQDSTVTEGNPGDPQNILAYQVTAVTSDGKPLAQNVSFTFNIDGAATEGNPGSGADYGSLDGQYTLQAGTPSGSGAGLHAGIYGDTVVEPDETVTGVLSAPVGAVLGSNNVSATIVNDDTAAPQQTVTLNLTVQDNHEPEGNPGDPQNTLRYQVTAITSDGQPLQQAVTYNFSTTGTATAGTAAAGADYGSADGQYTIQAGKASGDGNGFHLGIYGDTVVEPDETVTATISSPVNAVVGINNVTSTIANDDSAPAPQPGLFGNDPTADEGSNLVFNVFLDSPSTTPVTVDYYTSGGNASPGYDYTPVAGTLTFAPGETSQTVTVATVDDALDEPGEFENFALHWSNPQGAYLRDTGSEGRITDNDEPARQPGLFGNDPTAVEGSNLVFNVFLDSPSTTPVTVEYYTDLGTATPGDDYTRTTGTLTFAPGETSQTVTVPTIDDSVDEPGEFENFALFWQNPQGAYLRDTGSEGRITDNDEPAVQPGLFGNDPTAVEGDNLVFNVFLDRPSTTPVTVGYYTDLGTATAGSDYVSQNGTLTFAPGETSQTITVRTLEDALDEPIENFGLFWNEPQGAYLRDTSSNGQITDNDLF